MGQDELHYCAHCGAAHTRQQETCFACGHSLAEQQADIGAQEQILAGRYKLLEQVGTGGFGAVYKALDMDEHNRVVAVKQVNLRSLSPREMIEATDAFNREVQFLSTLSNRHLPKVYAYFTDTEHWYLVMQFVKGETLEQYLRETTSLDNNASRKLPIDEVLEIARQLCSVLFYLHNWQPPIVYRDLKPANIMRTPGGQLYLIDFGIARSFKPGQKKDTIPFGSPGYAAPEQYGKAQTTPRADIYSLGVLLYHLISGQNPEEGNVTFAPLRLYGAKDFAELEALIMQMVEFEVEKRPQNIAIVATTIKHIIAEREDIIKYSNPSVSVSTTPLGQANISGQHYSTAYYNPATTTSPSAAQQQVQQQPTPLQAGNAGQKTSRRRLLRGAGAAAGLILASNSILHLLASQSNTSPTPTIAPQPTSVPPLRLSRDNLNPITVRTKDNIYKVLFSPDSTKFAILGRNTVASVIAVYEVTNLQIPLNNFAIYATDQVHTYSWSMDGKYIIAGTETHAYILPLSTQGSLTAGTPRQLSLQPVSAIATIQCSPVDHSFLIMSNDGHIQIFYSSNANDLAQWQPIPHMLNDGHTSYPSYLQLDQKLATWSGEKLVYIDSKNRLIFYDMYTSMTQHYSLPPSSAFTTISSGPIGPSIAVGTQTGQGYIVNTADNTTQHFTPSQTPITDIAWYPLFGQFVVANHNGLSIWDNQASPSSATQLLNAQSIVSVSAAQKQNDSGIYLLSASETRTFVAWQIKQKQSE